jgi:hypothetical protein
MDSIRRIRAVVVPMLLACIAVPVPAQDSPSYVHRLRGAEIPLPEAQFILYQYVAGSDDIDPDEQLRAEVRTQLDFGNARFYALLDHMRETVDASRAFADAQNSRICERREELDTVEALGAALDASKEALRKHQAELMEQAKPILGAAGEPKFVALLKSLRDRMVVSRVDYTALLVAQKIEASAALGEICGEADEAARPAEGQEPQQG